MTTHIPKDVMAIAKEFRPNNTRAFFWFLETLILLIIALGGANYFLGKSFIIFGFFLLLAGFAFVKMFTIQHDCGHYSFLKTKKANDIFGNILSAFTFTPYAYWKRHHNLHHNFVGNLDKRGEDGYVWGGYWIITKKEYQNLSLGKKIAYLIYHYPFFLLFIWPFLNFLVNYRLPIGKTINIQDKKSILLNNVLIACFLALLYVFLGTDFILYIFFPTFFIASIIGPRLFMVQHSYEDAYWEHNNHWNFMDAALQGSSFYILPKWLHYLTGNIGYHHVHHLFSSIPSYKLPQCYAGYEIFKKEGLKISDTFAIPTLYVWDEEGKKLTGLKDMRYVSYVLYALFLILSFVLGYIHVDQFIGIIVCILFGINLFPIVFAKNTFKLTFFLSFCGMNYLYFYYVGSHLTELNLIGFGIAIVFVLFFYLLYSLRSILGLLRYFCKA